MGKKKRSQPDLDEILARPWCYYCERDFDDLKILISHQKAKHFKCDRCGRRLNTAGGLSVHMTQVHKESLTTIENALPNRAGLEVEIFGMEGIPEDVVIAHRQRVATQFVAAGNQPAQNNANSGSGGLGPNPAKKPKIETGSDLKKKLAEHRARKAAEEAAAANGGSPAVDTPVAQTLPVQPAFAGPPQGFTPPQFAAPFSGPPASVPMNGAPGYNGYPPQYGQPVPPFQPPQTFASPPIPFGQQPFQPPFQAPPGAYAPPSQYQTGPPNIPPRAFGSNSPDVPYQASQAPPQNIPPRPVSLTPAPGLPQRPAFGAPTVNAFQLQQMHQGHVPSQSVPFTDQAKPLNGTAAPAPAPANVGVTPAAQVAQLSQPQAPSNQADEQPAKQESKPAEAAVEKKSKKDKDKDVKLVYSDNEVSPEEKLSKLAKYAFNPAHRDGASTTAITA